MRPEIPDELAARGADVAEYYGYTSNGELARDAYRRFVEVLEQKQAAAEQLDEAFTTDVSPDDITRHHGKVFITPPSADAGDSDA